MLKYAKIINEETKQCDIGVGTNVEFYKSIGMTEIDVEQAYDGNWYVAGYVPQPSVDYQNEQIRQQRQARYVEESDPLRLDYDEALARGQEDANDLKIQWLLSKDKIREELPYIEEEKEEEDDGTTDVA